MRLTLPFLVYLLLFVVSFSYGYIKTCNITDYGAKGNGKTDNTQFIQSAIDDCSKATDNSNNDISLILLPFLSNTNKKETIYMSGAVFLKSNIDFYIENNVRLLGVSADSDINKTYPYIYTRREGTMIMTHSSLLNGGLCLNLTYNASAIGDQCKQWNKLKNIRIVGDGIIDGNGDSGWYNQSSGYLRDTRPCLLNLMWIHGLTLSNVTLTNPPFWTLHPIFSNNILIDNVSIINNAPNGDGVDPDSCSNVLIQNSYISTGDDQIAIKSGKDADGRAVGIPTNNVSIINCIFGEGNGLSIGSEMSGNVTNVLFDNITVNGHQKQGPHIKSNADRGGMVANVIYRNIKIKDIYKTGISIDEDYGGSNGNHYPLFKNISLINVNITVEKNGVDGVFDCYSESPCHDIMLDNVHVTGGSDFQCKNAYGTATNTSPKSCLITKANV